MIVQRSPFKHADKECCNGFPGAGIPCLLRNWHLPSLQASIEVTKKIHRETFALLCQIAFSSPADVTCKAILNNYYFSWR